MKVISVNYSGVKTIAHEGKIVTTGIFKQPSLEPAVVDFDGIKGDAQADLVNHGGPHKAIYGFSSHHYDYWRKKLERNNIPFGTFGENLTISHLNESDVCIGDQYQIGDCILEVSQPRVPCFKLSIALKNKFAVKSFTATYNTGVYFRVINPGTIAINEDVIKINSVKPSVSVQSLFKAKFEKNNPNRDKIFEMARKIEQLAPEWQEKL